MLIEIRVEALEGVHFNFGDTHEDSKLVSVRVIDDDYWGYRMIECASGGSISSGRSILICGLSG